MTDESTDRKNRVIRLANVARFAFNEGKEAIAVSCAGPEVDASMVSCINKMLRPHGIEVSATDGGLDLKPFGDENV